jgi:hypothetical protein
VTNRSTQKKILYKDTNQSAGSNADVITAHVAATIPSTRFASVTASFPPAIGAHKDEYNITSALH